MNWAGELKSNGASAAEELGGLEGRSGSDGVWPTDFIDAALGVSEMG